MLVYERKSKKSLHEFNEDGDDQDSKVIPYNEIQKEVPDWIKSQVL